MNRSAKLQKSIIWLGELASATNFATDEMLRQLDSWGIVDYEPETELVTFIDLGKQLYRELAGRGPNRNI